MIDRRDVLLGCGSALAMMAMPVRAAETGGKVYRVPVDLASGRLLVSCTIEGKGPFNLGIDTGGVVSMIDLALARQLNLNIRGLTSLGIAGKIDRYPMFEARELIFGNAFRQERVLLAGVLAPRLGRDVVGMLAAGCMTTMDSELDFVAREWRIYRDGGPQRAGWFPHDRAIRPSRVGSPHLFGTAALGGQGLRCLLDTGAPGGALLFPKVARKCGVDLERQNWSPSQVNGRSAQVFRSATPLQIGSLTIERPLITVHDDAPDFVGDGVIGLPIIQRMNLATEVNRGLLWTQPNGLPTAPEHYNMSGLWIDRKGKELLAGAVGRGSPADKAGIARGDLIGGASFLPLIVRLNGKPGDSVPLSVSRGGARRDLTLVLEDYL